MLRYVLVLILFSIAIPLVMISLEPDSPVQDDPVYDEDAFVEQQAPYSSAAAGTSSSRG